jgi:hypothetical protein
MGGAYRSRRTPGVQSTSVRSLGDADAATLRLVGELHELAQSPEAAVDTVVRHVVAIVTARRRLE